MQWVDDIFIINKSGVPYWSYCYGGENCMRFPDHMLQTGILAAFFSFGREFGQKVIEKVEFDTGHYFFYFDDPIITIFATNKDVDTNIIRNKVEQATDLFKEKYGEQVVNQPFIQPEDYEEMGDLLKEKGIVDYEPKMPLLKMLSLVKEKKWWQRFFK